MSLARTLARRAAVQAVYQWQLARDSLPDIERQFVEELQLAKSLYRRHAEGFELSPPEREQLEELLEKFGRSQGTDEVEEEDVTLEQRASQCQVPDVQVGYFKELLHGVANNLALLDAALAKYLDRPIDEVDPVERAILRIGCYEFMRRPETPYRVILNEAINLAKEFGAAQSYRYVNGILDRVAHECRAVEMAARRRGVNLPGSMQRPGEFEIIRRFFSGQRVADVNTEIGIGDDCAVLNFTAAARLALTTDTLVAGIHFFSDTDPTRLGHKALAVNLSDLAAMGARPRWALLALTLPENDPEWIAAFAQGFFRLAERHRVQLIGGDTTRGPLAITVHALGTVDGGPGVKRAGAKPGDAIYLTGSIGLAGLGLRIRQGAYLVPDEEALDRLEAPQPRTDFGIRLGEFASAGIDVSDGLAADLGHILEQSSVGAEVDWESLPLSAGVGRYVADSGDWQMPLVAGDDYELCFTASPAYAQAIASAADATATPVRRIGTIRTGSGLIIRRRGRPVELSRSGYLHFVSGEARR